MSAVNDFGTHHGSPYYGVNEMIARRWGQDLLEDEDATSFSFADTQAGALAAAMSDPPALITFDVKLVIGTGPLAVSAIHGALGPIPVIFITGTPADCHPCNPLGRILQKPLDQGELAAAFHEMVQA